MNRKERQRGKKKPRWMLGFHSKRKARDVKNARGDE
tara:strand:+ start:889 stop:996 length:108 start_codon:yes stop_codon:yes gene_type:complete